MPRYAFNESHAQCPRLAGSHALGAYGCFVYLLKDALCILHEQFARRTDFHAARKPLEEFKPNLLFQILNLAGQSGLSDAKPQGCPSVVLFLAYGHEIAQMSQFHCDTLSLLVE